METRDCPPITDALIEYLDEKYPLLRPKVETTLAQVHAIAGHRDIIEHLQAVQAVQRRKG